MHTDLVIAWRQIYDLTLVNATMQNAKFGGQGNSSLSKSTDITLCVTLMWKNLNLQWISVQIHAVKCPSCEWLVCSKHPMEVEFSLTYEYLPEPTNKSYPGPAEFSPHPLMPFMLKFPISYESWLFIWKSLRSTTILNHPSIVLTFIYNSTWF
jgi:hypothetical protein